MSFKRQNHKPKWQLQAVPHAIRLDVVTYLMAAEKAKNRDLAIRKMLYYRNNTFQAKKDQFYDGTNKVMKVIAEESQKKVHEEFYNTKIELLRKRNANDDARVRDLASTARGKVHAHFITMVDECAQWGMDTNTARRDLVEERDKALTQIVGSLRSINDNGEKQYTKWEENIKKEEADRLMQVEQKTVFEEIMRKGFQRELEMDDQILALRPALQKMVTNRLELATKSKNVVRSSSKRGRRRADSASSSTSTKRSSSTSTTRSSTGSSQNGRRGRSPKSYGGRKTRGKKQAKSPKSKKLRFRTPTPRKTRSKKQKMRKRGWDKTRCPKEIAKSDMDFKALHSIELHLKPFVPTVLQGDVLS